MLQRRREFGLERQDILFAGHARRRHRADEDGEPRAGLVVSKQRLQPPNPSRRPFAGKLHENRAGGGQRHLTQTERRPFAALQRGDCV